MKMTLNNPLSASKNKFHGFVSGLRHSAFIGNLLGLKHEAHVISKPSKEKANYEESVIYVGCIHGGNEEIYRRLEILISFPSEYLIFAGDITGTPEMEKLKKYFYDEKEKYNNKLFNKYPYFGDWAATLTRFERQKLFLSLEVHAKRLLKIIQKIEKQGTKIYLLEGNWDNKLTSGITIIAGDDIKQIFDVPAYFENNGYKFISRLSTLETKSIFHIFLPYISLLKFNETERGQIRKIKSEIAKAKNAGKAIVMVGHAEANWRIHHLFQENPLISGDRQKVITNFGRAMAIFKPDEVIYPHQHARIRDEEGKLIKIDTKYILQVYGDKVCLVDDPLKIKPENKNIIASYIPFGYMAEE